MLSPARIGDAELEALISREKAELERRVRLYRKGRAALALRDRVVILIDDGVATGVTYYGGSSSRAPSGTGKN